MKSDVDTAGGTHGGFLAFSGGANGAPTLVASEVGIAEHDRVDLVSVATNVPDLAEV